MDPRRLGHVLECLYVEYTFGKDDALKYTNGYKSHVRNRQPIITTRGLHQTPPQDMYFKGALMLNTLRNVVNDDAKWWKTIHDVFQHFKYRNIMTEDLVAYMNEDTGMKLTPIFDEYLRHAALPTLELKFDEAAGTVSYRWKADVAAFAMPVRVGDPGQLADRHAGDDALADAEDAAGQGRVPGGDGPVLRERQGLVAGRRSEARGRGPG